MSIEEFLKLQRAFQNETESFVLQFFVELKGSFALLITSKAQEFKRNF